MSKVTAGDIESLVEIFDGSDWDELHFEMAGFEIRLSKNPEDRERRVAAADGGGKASSASTAVAAPKSHDQAAPEQEVPAHWLAVRAPNLGTFYRSPKPGAAPSVELGRTVSADMEVCLIEVMKLFTSVCAGTPGVIRKICVADSEMVEFGQALFYIEPAG